MRRTRKQKKRKREDYIIRIVYDENCEGLCGIFNQKSNIIETTVTQEGLKGKKDSIVVETTKEKYEGYDLIYITGDREKEKKGKNFKPTKKTGIVRLTGSFVHLPKENQREILSLLKENLNVKEWLGREITVSKKEYKQKFYKTGHTTKWRGLST